MTTYLANYSIAATNGTGPTTTGQVTVLNSDLTLVIGSATSFITEFQVGDVIHVNGESHAVASIVDSSNLHTVTAFSVQFTSGQSYTVTAMHNVESYAAHKPPKSNFKPYAEAFNLGNSLVRGGGLPTETWHWDWLTKTERDLFRTFCIGASNTVYIRTKVVDGASSNKDIYLTYQAVMIWPLDESGSRPMGKRLNFSLTFRSLVQL